ncbi:uncharacterized protein LOC124814394 isoform X1 [Hydra vulgaris]|uniref:uncharacterized protein LOC124814394 isoform X1 n=1 Tax=Hydra vulgaris TaxID=6087 RepID=UPI001F5F78A4|nr:uncharacterized protein LOC124814394 [Hydra vulgaris]
MSLYNQKELKVNVITLFCICSCLCFLTVLLDPLSKSHEGNTVILVGCESNVNLQHVDLTNLYPCTGCAQRIRVAVKIHDNEKNGRRRKNNFFNYVECHLPDFIPILPNFIKSYSAHMLTQVSHKGDINYIFNGLSAVRFPVRQLSVDWNLKYTVFSWLYIEPYNDRQYILSWSCGENSALNNMGFYVTRHLNEKYAEFSFYQIYQSSSGLDCVVQNKWKYEILHWHYFSLSYDNCSVALSIDGYLLKPSSNVTDFHLPRHHIQPKFVVGACWVGNADKYSYFFHGEMSSLVMLTGQYAHFQHSQCLLQPKERFLSSSAYNLKTIKENVWFIEANLTQLEAEILLENISYSNLDYISNFQLKDIGTEIHNLDKGLVVYSHQYIKIERKSSTLEIRGDCSSQQLISSNSIILCEQIHILSNSCSQGIIDSLVIVSENIPLFIPTHMLHKYHLLFTQYDFGIKIEGIAPMKHYNTILSMIQVFPNVSEDISSKISIYVSSNKVKSNKFNLNILIAKKMVVITNQDHISNDCFKDKLTYYTNMFFCFLLALLAGALVATICILIWKNRRHTEKNEFDISKSALNSSFFYESDLHLFINPADRVCITNNPSDDILRRRNHSNSLSSDESDSSGYLDDNDSIRQLEWENLESSFADILLEKKSNKLLSDVDKKNLLLDF